VAETIKDVVMDAKGNPTLAGTGISSHPEMVKELGKALSPLLDAALQDRDWRNRESLQLVDTCSILLQALSLHLEGCSAAKMSPSLGRTVMSCVRTSGVSGKAMRLSTPMPRSNPVDVSILCCSDLKSSR
jgi:hypothetical protein